MEDKLQQFRKNIQKIEHGLLKNRVVVLSEGFGEESDASTYTGKRVVQQLINHKFNVINIDPAKKDFTKLVNPKTDIVFNCLHGNFGESGHVPAILDYLKVRYTFSGIYPSVVTNG